MTKDDIAELKDQWLANSRLWNIEDTKGFENHYIELKAYRIGVETDTKQLWRKLIMINAINWNCNINLAEYLLELDKRITKLENHGE